MSHARLTDASGASTGRFVSVFAGRFSSFLLNFRTLLYGVLQDIIYFPAETGSEQADLQPATELRAQLDFDDLSLYAVIARLEGELGEKRSDTQIAECETLGQLVSLYHG